MILFSPTFPHRFETQIGVGYINSEETKKSQSGGPDNKINWTRYPIELMHYYHNVRENFRIGWGATYHTNNSIELSLSGNTSKISVDNSLGWVFALEKVTNHDGDKFIKDFATIGLRFQSMDYHSNKFNKEVRGNSVSLIVSILFF